MNALVQQLAIYGTYHRDRRNIASHCFGIPMIILGLDILLSRPDVAVAKLSLTPALLLSVLLGIYYLRANLLFGLVISAWLILFVVMAQAIAAASDSAWLFGGLGLLVGGWVLQFIGHYYEGRKPAFFDDIRGLLIGPGFIALELLAGIGLFRKLMQQTRGYEQQLLANEQTNHSDNAL